MKFIYYYLISLFFFIGCGDYRNKNKQMIGSFIKEIILNQRYTNNDLKKFVDLDETNNNFKNKIIRMNTKFLKESIEKNNMEYKLFSDKEIRKQKIKSNFEFNDYDKVYHLVIKSKVITSFIIEKDKIISFSYNIIKNKRIPRTPLLLK